MRSPVQFRVSKDSPLKVLEGAGTGLVGAFWLEIVTIVTPEARGITAMCMRLNASLLQNTIRLIFQRLKGQKPPPPPPPPH